MSDYSIKNKQDWRPATQLVRGGTTRTEFSETAEGMFLTSGYVYDCAEEAEQAFQAEIQRFVYSRYANPTVAMFQERLALLEGADFCAATSSGMAAMYSAIASQLKAGDRVVASRALFGSCFYIINTQLPMMGVETVCVDGTDLDAWERELSAKPTQVVFLESPSNPCLEIIDIKAVCEIAHKHGAKVVIDNAFASPVLQKPLDLGADMVIYSATKHIDGQGRCMGGAILSNDEKFIADQLTPFLRNTGPSISPFNAWVLLKALETLDLRIERHCQNALAVANHLEARGDVAKVLYPGLPSHPQHDIAMKQMSKGGTMVAFEVGDDKETAFKFLNALQMVDISNNLGDAKSLITHPPTTTHSKLTAEEKLEIGINEGLVRLSVGLEDAADITDDLDFAFQIARG